MGITRTDVPIAVFVLSFLAFLARSGIAMAVRAVVKLIINALTGW